MKNIFKKLIVGSFLVISVLGVFATGCKKITANIPVNGNEEPLKPIESPITDGEGNDLSGNKIYEMPQSMVFSAPALQAATNANEVTVTATVTPADAADKRLKWDIGFKNPNSTWASGKDVSDYVKITTMALYGPTVTVTYVEIFNEQIILTCSSYAYPNIKADCTIDCIGYYGYESTTISSIYLKNTTEAFGTLEFNQYGYDDYIELPDSRYDQYRTKLTIKRVFYGTVKDPQESQYTFNSVKFGDESEQFLEEYGVSEILSFTAIDEDWSDDEVSYSIYGIMDKTFAKAAQTKISTSSEYDNFWNAVKSNINYLQIDVNLESNNPEDEFYTISFDISPQSKPTWSERWKL